MVLKSKQMNEHSPRCFNQESPLQERINSERQNASDYQRFTYATHERRLPPSPPMQHYPHRNKRNGKNPNGEIKNAVASIHVPISLHGERYRVERLPTIWTNPPAKTASGQPCVKPIILTEVVPGYIASCCYS